MNFYLLLILTLLVIFNIFLCYQYPDISVKSTIDGKYYNVKQKYNDRIEAANYLARLNKINLQIINHMKKKYKHTKMERDINYLEYNYTTGSSLSENIPRTINNTSYVLNKGDVIRICLRDGDGNFHDFQTVLFVSLHELTHMYDREYRHGKTFWKKFKIILENAIELKIYTPVNYNNNPTKYCGMNINSNPLYDKLY